MKTVRILSMDGGGIRGILPARVLQHIEETTGKPASQLFDLISGTSTGGILACGLLAGLSAKSLGDLYAQRGDEIFANARTVGSVFTGPKYSATSLETILQQTLGETWLSETKGLEMLVPSYCIQAPAPVPIDGGGVMSSQLPMAFTTWQARATLLRPGQDPRAGDWKLRCQCRFKFPHMCRLKTPHFDA